MNPDLDWLLLSMLILYQGVSSTLERQPQHGTIRHGDLEVPNYLARLPNTHFTPTPQYQANVVPYKHVTEDLPSPTHTYSHTYDSFNKGPSVQPYNSFNKGPSVQPFNSFNKGSSVQQYNSFKNGPSDRPTIEKINWAQYSRLRGIQAMNREYKTAVSPSIQVLDGASQMITNVKGVGLVVKSDDQQKMMKWKTGNRNQLMGNHKLKQKDNNHQNYNNIINFQKEKYMPRQTYEVYKNNLRGTSNMHTNVRQATDYSMYRDHGGHIKQFVNISPNVRVSTNNRVIMNQIRGNVGEEEHHMLQLDDKNTRPSHKYMPSTGQRLVTLIPRTNRGKEGQRQNSLVWNR